MSRVRKKILGFLSLAFVVGMTVAAAILPSTEASAASSSVKVSFTIYNTTPMLGLDSPPDASMHYDNHAIIFGINHQNIKTISLFVSNPDGTNTFHDLALSDDGVTSIPFSPAGYGDYTVVLSGTDLDDKPIDPVYSTFAFHAITASDNGNGNIRVNYGPATCSLSFQLYNVDDADSFSPLLNPPYVVNNLSSLPGYPNFADIEIPNIASLGASELRVVVTALSCADATGLEHSETSTWGSIQPPKTGALYILGITVTHIDYVITGLVAFVLVSLCIALFIRRKKINTNKTYKKPNKHKPRKKS